MCQAGHEIEPDKQTKAFTVHVSAASNNKKCAWQGERNQVLVKETVYPQPAPFGDTNKAVWDHCHSAGRKFKIYIRNEKEQQTTLQNTIISGA